jgi:sugar-specific transcriptional regulator TrmB
MAESTLMLSEELVRWRRRQQHLEENLRRLSEEEERLTRELVKAEKHWLFLPAGPTGATGTVVWSPSEKAERPVVGRVIFVVVAC